MVIGGFSLVVFHSRLRRSGRAAARADELMQFVYQKALAAMWIVLKDSFWEVL
jgi:hypothetical protein